VSGRAVIKLHYAPGFASLVPHIVLREIGIAFELVRVDRDKGEHKTPAYLKLNPNGLIPVLEDGPLVLYETAAICLHLVDTHPQAGLAPAPGTAERAQFYKWLIWLTNTVQARVIDLNYPHRMVDDGNTEGAAQVKRRSHDKLVECLQQIDDELARHGQPWLLGERYSAADAYAWLMCRWTRNFAERPARSFAHIGPYLQRVMARPAVRAAIEAEGLQQPWV
jgi:glutathione S-transferase